MDTDKKMGMPAVVAAGFLTLAPARADTAPQSTVNAPFEVAAGAWVGSRLGVHWFSDIWGAVDGGARARAIERMRALGAGYAVVLVHPDYPDRNDGVIRELQAAGITPVARLYDPGSPDAWDDAAVARLVHASRRLAALGVKLLQVGNEPNHGETSNLAQRPTLDPGEYVRLSIFNYARAMGAIKAALGDAVRLGTPPLAPGTPDSPAEGYFPSRDIQGPGYFSTMLDGFARYERNAGLRIVDWIATHTYADIGYEKGVQDSGWYPARAAALLGRRVRALSTEGGPHPSQWGPGTVSQLQASIAYLEQDALATDCLWPLHGDGWQRNALVEPAAGYEEALLWLDARFGPGAQSAFSR